MHAHVEERKHNPRFHFRGKTFKKWVDLDPVLVVNELQEFLSSRKCLSQEYILLYKGQQTDNAETDLYKLTLYSFTGGAHLQVHCSVLNSEYSSSEHFMERVLSI